MLIGISLVGGFFGNFEKMTTLKHHLCNSCKANIDCLSSCFKSNCECNTVSFSFIVSLKNICSKSLITAIGILKINRAISFS